MIHMTAIASARRRRKLHRRYSPAEITTTPRDVMPPRLMRDVVARRYERLMPTYAMPYAFSASDVAATRL